LVLAGGAREGRQQTGLHVSTERNSGLAKRYSHWIACPTVCAGRKSGGTSKCRIPASPAAARCEK